jgi:Response regulators consisting of a CheY-like receiver domain and a winged-helix DNA-binding domain
MRNWIIIEKGEPYIKGALIEILQNGLWMGRISAQNISLDMNFASLFISRKHCRIFYDGMKVILADTGSKHGTYINGDRVLSNGQRILNNGDRISLAHGIVVMQFRQEELCDDTVDFSDTQANKIKTVEKPIKINSEKRECIVGDQIVLLTSKEWNCLNLLYTNANKSISYNELAASVWAERMGTSYETVDVGRDEINVLLYRVRKKLGTKGNLIKSIRGFGFMLEL